MEKTELFICKCHDISHQLVLGTFEPTEDEERVVYGCFHIVHLEFWDKLKSATKYLFGRKRKDGDFDALLLRPEDADRLEWFANFLDGGTSATDMAVAPFAFTFCSKENVYDVALEFYQYTLNDGTVYSEYEISVCVSLLTSSTCHPKIFVKEFSYFLMPCYQHCLGVNLLVQRELNLYGCDGLSQCKHLVYAHLNLS